MVTGSGQPISRVALPHPDLAGVHFTGSTGTFQHMWRTVGEHISGYHGYPRLVGETGGKDFVIAHPSADPAVLSTVLLRGAFEYQGQKCSAASRAYIPRSVWARMGDDFVAAVRSLTMGDVAADLSLYMGAVIDDKAYATHADALARARTTPTIEVLAGGQTSDTDGYFVQPTVLRGSDPTDEIFSTEYFGPILSVHVFDDADYDRVVAQAADISPYALTGSIIATDRTAIAAATQSLRYAAGNFYINDKPTGAVVGQQPFGGARASGTNDKAGSIFNLIRWVNARTIKETLVPPVDYRYPHMG
jgi:1-pyrroline-5-carboxylate dehydrogenase